MGVPRGGSRRRQQQHGQPTTHDGRPDGCGGQHYNYLGHNRRRGGLNHGSGGRGRGTRGRRLHHHGHGQRKRSKRRVHPGASRLGRRRLCDLPLEYPPTALCLRGRCVALRSGPRASIGGPPLLCSDAEENSGCVRKTTSCSSCRRAGCVGVLVDTHADCTGSLARIELGGGTCFGGPALAGVGGWGKGSLLEATQSRSRPAVSGAFPKQGLTNRVISHRFLLLA